MWVRDAFECLARGQRLVGADRWLALLETRGPTSPEGPLTHDWLLPSHRDASQIGLNLFSHDPEQSQVVRLALAEAGGDGPWLVSDPDLRFHGGMVWRGGEGVIKIYASGPPPALEPVATALRIPIDDDVFALGVDVTHRAERARSYRRAHTLDHSVRWAAYPAWAALEPAGLSHRVVAVLDPPHADVAKRSFDHIFSPRADIEALHALAAAVARIDGALSPSFDPGLLSSLEAKLPDLTVRPVSYEVDVFADGRKHTDALVTISRGWGGGSPC